MQMGKTTEDYYLAFFLPFSPFRFMKSQEKKKALAIHVHHFQMRQSDGIETNLCLSLFSSLPLLLYFIL